MKSKRWYAERCLVNLLKEPRTISDIEDIITALYTIRKQYESVEKEFDKTGLPMCSGVS